MIGCSFQKELKLRNVEQKKVLLHSAKCLVIDEPEAHLYHFPLINYSLGIFQPNVLIKKRFYK